MDADLQLALENLAKALRQAIEGSSDVDAALAEVRTEGFQAMLLLEVTVALSKLPALGGSAEASEADAADCTTLVPARLQLPAISRPRAESDGGEIAGERDLGDGGVEAASDDVTQAEDAPAPWDFDPTDREFLRSIKIRID